MKVERINENQIKVIMSAQDLIDRDLTMSEIAYGSEKGQELFEEVMAHVKEVGGFSFDESKPIIIEAIPMSKTEITLIISRLGQFSDIEQNFNFIPQTKEERKYVKKPAEPKPAVNMHNENTVLIYCMKALDDVINACKRIASIYNGTNFLYKYEKKYYLIVHSEASGENEKENADFVLAEKIIADYGQKYLSSPLAKMYLLERGELITEQAVQKFKNI